MMNMWVVLVLAATGCAGQAQKSTPEKVNRFPEERFLTATASGATEMEAKNRALAELAQVFESRVYSETSSRSHSLIGATAQEQFEKEVDSFFRIHSSIELRAPELVNFAGILILTCSLPRPYWIASRPDGSGRRNSNRSRTGWKQNTRLCRKFPVNCPA
jgi:hypothetical protein